MLHLLMATIARMKSFDEIIFTVILKTLTNLCEMKETVASFNKIGVVDTLMIRLYSNLEERAWLKCAYLLQCLAALSFDTDGAVLIGKVSGGSFFLL